MDVNAIDGFDEPLEHLRAALAASGVVGTWDVGRRVAHYGQGAAKRLAPDSDLAGKPLHAQAAIAGMHPDDVAWMREFIRVEVDDPGGRLRASAGLALSVSHETPAAPSRPGGAPR